MNYQETFAARGSSYHRAMQRWPHARAEDFLMPLSWLEPQPGETLLDVPAGGGYLRRYLPAGCRWMGHEPCETFDDEGSDAEPTDLLPLPWHDGCADAAVSIAGVHHLDDKAPLYRELRRVVRPGGRLLLADVHQDSAVARFLDGFVGRFNSTGHAGHYLGAQTCGELEVNGWRVQRAQRLSLGWWFADRESLAQYCRMLFDMPAVDEAEILAAIGQTLGFRNSPGRVGFAWELYLLLAHAA